MKTTSSSRPTLFDELMRHPEKLEAALNAARIENEAFAASRKFGLSDAGHARQDTSFENEDARNSINAEFAELPH